MIPDVDISEHDSPPLACFETVFLTILAVAFFVCCITPGLMPQLVKTVWRRSQKDYFYFLYLRVRIANLQQGRPLSILIFE